MKEKQTGLTHEKDRDAIKRKESRRQALCCTVVENVVPFLREIFQDWIWKGKHTECLEYSQVGMPSWVYQLDFIAQSSEVASRLKTYISRLLGY